MCFGLEAGAMMAIGSAMSAVSTVVGAASSSAAAESEAAFRNYQIEVQNQQLKDEQDMTMLKAQQVEGQRLEQVRRMRAVNEAAVAASGVSENKSYLEGVEPYNQRQANQDIATLRLNSADQVNRIAQQIQVNKVEGQFATAKAGMVSSAAWTGGLFNAAGSLVKGYGQYKYYG